MSKKQHMGSHNSSAIPDEQMSRLGYDPRMNLSSRVRGALKHTAAKKRRQRNRKVAEDE